MFCTHCGSKLPEGARFCTNCGTPVEDAPAAPAEVVEPEAVETDAAPEAEVEGTSESAAGKSAETETAAPVEMTEEDTKEIAENESVEAEAENVADVAQADEPADVADPAETVDAAEAEAIFEDADNAAVAVDFPDDDPTTLVEPVSNDDATSLFDASDDATTAVPIDEDAEATAAAMESLGVAGPTAGDTVVENPIDMNAYAQPAQPQQVPADMTMPQQPLPQQMPVAQDPTQPQQAAGPQKKRKRWAIAAGLGLVAVGAAVAAIVFLAPNANAVEVTSGSQDAVMCTVDTKVIPKKKDRVIHSYTATLTPKNGGKSYKIKVKGDDGFTIGDFGKVKPGDYRCVIETPKGETVQHFNTKVVKAGATDKDGNKPAENVTVKTSNKSQDDSNEAENSGGSSQDTSTSGSSSSTGSTSGGSSSGNSSSSTSGGSSSSSSQHKPQGGSQNSSSSSSKPQDTKAPATIDDATYKAACKAYKTKIKELKRTYGEPKLASTGSGDDYQIGGLQLAQLVDFNGDGLEELVTVHSKTKASTFNKKTRLKNGDYVLEVWTYNGKKLVKLYSGSPQGSNGGYVFVTIEKKNCGDQVDNKLYLAQNISNDSAVLVSGKKSSDTVDCKYFTYDGTQFSALEDDVHGDSFDDQSSYLIKGYDTNLEDQDATAPENHIDTTKLNLNDTVDTIENTLNVLDTKISGTEDSASSSSSKSSSSKSSSSKSSSSSNSSSSSDDDDDDYSYDDDDGYSYDDDSDYDDDDYDSDDDDSDYDDDYDDDDDDTDSYASQSSQPVEFTDWDY